MAKIFESSTKGITDFCDKVSETILNQSLALFAGAGSSLQYGGSDWKALLRRSYNTVGNPEWGATDYAQYLILKGVHLKEEIAKNLLNFKSDICVEKSDTFLNYLLDFDIDNIRQRIMTALLKMFWSLKERSSMKSILMLILI